MAKGLRCAGLEGFCVDLPLAAGFKPGKTFTQGIKSCLGAIDQLQLIEDIAHMDPHRALLDRKGAGYLLVRHTLGNTIGRQNIFILRGLYFWNNRSNYYHIRRATYSILEPGIKAKIPPDTIERLVQSPV
jgi:hypothetical protein